MECPRCNAEVTAGDNFCRKCGYVLGTQRALVPVNPPAPPVDWRPVRDLVIRAATALVVGTAAELLRREAQRQISPVALADHVESLVQRRQRPARREPARLPVRIVQPAPAETEESGIPHGVSITRYVFFQRIQIRR